jgi:hypothetical protein
MCDATYEWNLIGNVLKIVKTQVSFHNHGKKKYPFFITLPFCLEDEGKCILISP